MQAQTLSLWEVCHLRLRWRALWVLSIMRSHKTPAEGHCLLWLECWCSLGLTLKSGCHCNRWTLRGDWGMRVLPSWWD